MSLPEAKLHEIKDRLLVCRSQFQKVTNVNLDQTELTNICMMSRELFLSQPVYLELVAPIRICGDTHGQFYDLLRIFETGKLPPEDNYLFLGDYVDRGKYSVETITLLLVFKLLYPQNIYLLRGNHECASINRIYGFYDDCKRRWSVGGVKMWKTFGDCFNCLPIAATVNDRVFCCHGGISPHLSSMDQIRQIIRPTDIPDTGFLCDLLWSDPDKNAQNWGENDRGVSYVFGTRPVHEFCQKYDFDLVCRAHQVVEDGYEFFAEQKLVTVFSAPNYCGDNDNAAAILNIDENLLSSFTIVKPQHTVKR